jgi:hypothetical protein
MARNLTATETRSPAPLEGRTAQNVRGEAVRPAGVIDLPVEIYESSGCR